MCSILVAGCMADEPQMTGVSQAGTTFQGTTFQGTTFQGTTFQGTTFQGTTFQGITFDGAMYGSSAFVDGSIAGTALVAWRHRTDGTWEQRFPNKMCFWNALRTSWVSPCITFNLATSPSPLAGSTWPAQFVKADGTVITGTLQIGSTGQVGVVKSDSSYAMHRLDGSLGATGTTTTSSTYCDNPAGCRKNSDLWLYDLHLIDSDGAVLPFCPSGEWAMPLAGTWDDTGEHEPDDSRFTFACTNGTIAKCVRWGYRPWAKAIKHNGSAIQRNESVPTPMADYHQSCVRAAAADYCGIGHSFTTNGTLIDIYDFSIDGAGTEGFIPSTSSVQRLLGKPAPNALVWESTFDPDGGLYLDFIRHEELSTTGSYGSLLEQCPNRFTPPTAPDDVDGYYRPFDRTSSPVGDSWVSVDNTPVCGHVELTLGKFLHARCSSCTLAMWNDAANYSSCFDPINGGWTQRCVDRALACPTKTRMGAHSECVAAGPMDEYDSGCAIAVCMADSTCCTSAWTAQCASLANARCKGGREGGNILNPVGFCGVALPPSSF